MIRRAWWLGVLVCWTALAQAGGWRPATAAELERAVPQRAQVVNERVETERTSLSGVVDREGKMITAAVLITAGYSAAGKYSDTLDTQVPLRVGDTQLAAGHYLLGWTRGQDGLDVQIFSAADGKQVARAIAREDAQVKRVEQIKVWPPGVASASGRVQLGRFTFAFLPEK